MEKEIIAVLEEVKPGIDYAKEEALVSNEILTSFDLVMLIALLNEKFNINITVVDLIPENFENVQSIANLINKMK